ncbi:MAG TPA: hypothetical protein VID29_00185 [Solirubrobacteraceae bacterium]
MSALGPSRAIVERRAAAAHARRRRLLALDTAAGLALAGALLVFGPGLALLALAALLGLAACAISYRLSRRRRRARADPARGSATRYGVGRDPREPVAGDPRKPIEDDP